VRFLEGMNSQEVIDFNLYLSPFDHWSGVVTRTDGEAAVLKTADNSCTVPRIPDNGVVFRDFLYEDDSVNGPARTREGYVEVIEMGEVTNENPDDSDAFNPALWATHTSDGVPADCPALVDAWNSGGRWDVSNNRQIDPTVGGMYGYGVLISPPSGTAAGYDAVALDDFFIRQHTEPGNTLPSLQNAIPEAQVVDRQLVVDAFFDLPGVDSEIASANAVSSVIMHTNVLNDYVLAPEIDAGTDWVLTFPTKRFYVNIGGYDEDGDPEVDAVAPFDEHWSQRNSEACEKIEIRYWDREEDEERVEDVDFSPAPPSEELELCKEVNVVSFNNSDVLSASERIGVNIDVAFDNGWANVDFFDDDTPQRQIVGEDFLGAEQYTFFGLPVVGFAVQNYQNGNLNGVLSNYSASVEHKYRRLIDVDVD
jgi:hypothetical protein